MYYDFYYSAEEMADAIRFNFDDENEGQITFKDQPYTHCHTHGEEHRTRYTDSVFLGTGTIDDTNLKDLKPKPEIPISYFNDINFGWCFSRKY